MEDGTPKKVVETYSVDAISFSEAEKKILKEMEAYADGEVELVDLKIANYKEVFFADSDLADKWYKAKLSFITIDEKTDKERKTSVYYLVNAGNIEKAINNINEIMGGTMIDYVTCKVDETNIIDVFEYKSKEEKGDKSDNGEKVDKNEINVNMVYG